MLAVSGHVGHPRSLASVSLRARIGIDSSAPTTAMGTMGTPARMAVSTNPPRPKRLSW